MPQFRVEQYELHLTSYVVEAPNRAEAVRMVLNGEGGSSDETEYIETAEDYGMPVDHGSDLVTQLKSIGVRIDPNRQIIPSIRAVYEV